MADEGAVKEILLMSLGFLANCAPIVSGVVIIGLSLFAYSTAKPALRLLLFLCTPRFPRPSWKLRSGASGVLEGADSPRIGVLFS